MPMMWEKLEGFEWDAGNLHKSWEKHGVSPQEAEEIFFNEPLVVAEDAAHSGTERRCFALGRTHEGRHLFVVFTARGAKIRVISARPMNRKERKVYGEEN